MQNHLEMVLSSPSFWFRMLLGIALSLLGAVLLFFSMPPYGLWPLAIMGFAPMLLAQHRILPRTASSLAPAITIGGFWGILIPSIFGPFAEKVWFLQYLWLIVGCIVLLTDRGARSLHERTAYRWFVLEGALIWVGIEMIRNLIPFLGTSGFIGYAYYRSLWLIQPVSIFGIFGLNLLNMLAGYALGLATLAVYDHWGTRPAWLPLEALRTVELRFARRWLSGIGLAAAAWTILSLLLYFLPVQTPIVRVAAIQPANHDLQDFQKLTRQAAAQGARLVVWPEGGLGFDPQVKHTEELKSLARETGAYLVMGVGMPSRQGLRNEAIVLSPDGDFLGVYGKDHPMTYLGETSLTKGSYPVYQTDFGNLGTIICFDLDFNDTARKVVRNGARLLAVPSNDWPELYNKQYAYLTFRAVENRVATVKSDTSFDSVIIDPRGRLVASHLSPLASQAVIVGDVPLGTADAPHLYLGNWIGWLSLAGMLFFMLPNPALRRSEIPLPASQPTSNLIVDP